MDSGTYRVGDVHVIRLDDGEKIVSSILAYASQKQLQGAVIYSLIGAISHLKFITAGSNSIKPEPYTASRDKPFEIIGSGSIGLGDDGSPRVHIHMSCGSKDGEVVTGHLVEGTVKYFCEIILGELDGVLARRFDEKLGIEKLVS